MHVCLHHVCAFMLVCLQSIYLHVACMTYYVHVLHALGCACMYTTDGGLRKIHNDFFSKESMIRISLMNAADSSSPQHKETWNLYAKSQASQPVVLDRSVQCQPPTHQEGLPLLRGDAQKSGETFPLREVPKDKAHQTSTHQYAHSHTHMEVCVHGCNSFAPMRNAGGLASISMKCGSMNKSNRCPQNIRGS